nr:hypothetical protein [Tanacetum cinerariifolium]
MFNPLSSSQRERLDQNINREEIKRAVWDCGGDRAQSPDGFTFKFFKTFWDLIEGDVVRFVLDFFRTNSFPKGCNSSFIALIPKVHDANCINPVQSAFIKDRNILDGPLILNEILAWYQERNKKLMVFKVDFEKAFDSLRWNFLDTVMEKLDFGLKWRSWIQVSGLKINVHKSNVLGIGVSDDKINCLANVIGYGMAKLPLKYLGVPIGCNMHRCSDWYPIIQKFSSKLSLWKARLLSVGGRLTLIKLVLGNLPTYYMSIYLMPAVVRNKLESMRNKFFIGCDHDDKNKTWVKWKRCLASKTQGGLGIDFLSLCSRKIGNGESTYLWNDTWCGNLPFKIQYPRVYVLDTDKNGLIANQISLNDWSGILRRNPRGGSEQSQFHAMLFAIENVTLSDKGDSWQWWVNGCNGFSVALACSLVNSFFLDGDTVATRWNTFIPIKVNVLLWRLSLNKLSTRVNLDRKGIDIGSVLCLTHQGDVETVNHTFFNCVLAKDLWALMAKWWELDISICANILEWYTWLDYLHFSSMTRMFIERAGGILLWLYGVSVIICSFLSPLLRRG